MSIMSNLRTAVIAVAAVLNMTSDEMCFKGIGCFSNEAPFNNAAGHLPQSPDDIRVVFLLYTRHNRDVPRVISADPALVLASFLSPYRKSVFIIHGYRDDGRETWVMDMKNALLKQEDVNVVSVDWESGADQTDYNQAAANTRVVGALIAQLLNVLKNLRSLKYEDVHLVGHSLGAHIAGYAGERVKSVGRITGLDPAGLSFERQPFEVRLGAKKPMGHADFYPNGGKDQPGCTSSPRKHIFKLITGKFKSFQKGVACDHARARDYFIESITSTCRFTASLCRSYNAFVRGECPCRTTPCASMGFHARANITQGVYFLDTTDNSPDETCFNGIGCFSNEAPFNNAAGRLPQSPDAIRAVFSVYTRQNRNVPQVISANPVLVRASFLSPYRKSIFIIHGYRDDGRETWVMDMKNALLKQADVNVVSVDWERGANQADYNQAASNTRVVGALIAQLLTTLRQFRSLNYGDVHLVGHSLGAHIAGYAGERVKSVGRITGLDPAGLSFEGQPSEVRLDPTDALLVDVIHTDAQPITSLGLGAKKPMGHVDFYPNGGKDQPGCTRSPRTHLFKLITGKFRSFKKGIACDHARARDYFIESITSTCRFTANLCRSYNAFVRGDCPCRTTPCASMGFHARANSVHGKYFLDTTDKSPFCLDRN
ncbi:LIPR1-like protein [Mya arenaria]|uniref:LIPR1-like protein n=1 Tax=Mya arenaria TaxID=6604 RepID=A0ABY7FL58_MYAAR|nr:LIPR1-like protein [Mya arenaria]